MESAQYFFANLMTADAFKLAIGLVVLASIVELIAHIKELTKS